MKSSYHKVNVVVILTLAFLKSNQCAKVDVNNLNALWSLSSVNRGSRTLGANAGRNNVQGLTVVPNQRAYIHLVNASKSNFKRELPKIVTKQESLENRNTSRHKNYRRNKLLSSEDWTPRSIPLNYNQEFQPQIENSLKVFDNENNELTIGINDQDKNKAIDNKAAESTENVYFKKEQVIDNTAIPIIISSNSYIPKPIPLLKHTDSQSSRSNTGSVVPVKRVEPNLNMRRSFIDFDDDSDYDDEAEYSKVKRKHTAGEEEEGEEGEEDSNGEDYDPEGLEKKGRPKIKKKYLKYMLPLLLAYKLKFFTLVPLLMGGLVLLTGATGMAGFFFALFAAVMGLKGGH